MFRKFCRRSKMRKRSIAIFAVALALSLITFLPFALADPAHCKVTGGGWIIPCSGPEKATFGFNAMQNSPDQTPFPDPPVKGELEYIDHNTGMNVHGDVNIMVSVFPDAFLKNQEATFSGTCRVTGIAVPFDGWFFVYVRDNGEPGKSDLFRISVFTGAAMTPAQLFYDSGLQELGGGNIQTHPLPPPMNPEV